MYIFGLLSEIEFTWTEVAMKKPYKMTFIYIYEKFEVTYPVFVAYCF